MNCSCGAEMDKRMLPKAQWFRYKCKTCGMVKYKDMRSCDIDTVVA